MSRVCGRVSGARQTRHVRVRQRETCLLYRSRNAVQCSFTQTKEDYVGDTVAIAAILTILFAALIG